MGEIPTEVPVIIPVQKSNETQEITLAVTQESGIPLADLPTSEKVPEQNQCQPLSLEGMKLVSLEVVTDAIVQPNIILEDASSAKDVLATASADKAKIPLLKMNKLKSIAETVIK